MCVYERERERESYPEIERERKGEKGEKSNKDNKAAAKMADKEFNGPQASKARKARDSFALSRCFVSI